jgi:sulfate adenylyltransferase subunit 2
VHTNPDGVARGIGPITHGATVHTDVMKTQALKQALDQYGFDAAIGGARRDEEKSRAKERVFSFRTRSTAGIRSTSARAVGPVQRAHRRGESVRVFPLSNWTELDVWLYIFREGIPVPSLYFRAGAPGRRARRRAADGRRRRACRCATGKCRRCAACASARWVATR